MSWQANFRDYSTSSALRIDLSHNQLSLLQTISAGDIYEWRGRAGTHVFIPTVKALERKGLAEHNPLCKTENVPHAIEHRIKPKWVYRVTPAGAAVLSLAMLAGAIEPHPLSPHAAVGER